MKGRCFDSLRTLDKHGAEETQQPLGPRKQEKGEGWGAKIGPGTSLHKDAAVNVE